MAEQVRAGLEAESGKGKWGMRLVYTLNLSDQCVVIYGVTGEAMEARSFAKNMTMPGSIQREIESMIKAGVSP